MDKKKILLGMSGGVDSSVSAILLKEKGYDVIGCTMKLWNDECYAERQGGCCSLSSVYDAKRVCDLLDIPHYVLDFTKEFQEKIINNFINSYKQAITPNPCIECNRYMKFDLMYKKAQELGIEYIATGHYAKTEYSEEYKRYVLKKSNSIKKDQSYVLYNIPKEIVSKVIFPLGDFEDKKEIRAIAEKHKLKVANKPDSQEICFIPDNDYGKFIENNLAYTYVNNHVGADDPVRPKQGNIINTKGEILGKHNGIIHYTIGQRKGLGIAHPTPLYVQKIDIEKNEVVVGEEEEIYSSELIATDLNYILIDELKEPMEVYAKIRYARKSRTCNNLPNRCSNDWKGQACRGGRPCPP